MLCKSVAPDVKTRDFQYRLIHRILWTNEFLKKIRILSTDKCTFCRVETETMKHLFVDCALSDMIWDQVEKYISLKLGRGVHFTILDKLFGCIHENVLVNHLIILVKRHIYYCRYVDKLPNVSI